MTSKHPHVVFPLKVYLHHISQQYTHQMTLPVNTSHLDLPNRMCPSESCCYRLHTIIIEFITNKNYEIIIGHAQTTWRHFCGQGQVNLLREVRHMMRPRMNSSFCFLCIPFFITPCVYAIITKPLPFLSVSLSPTLVSTSIVPRIIEQASCTNQVLVHMLLILQPCTGIEFVQ